MPGFVLEKVTVSLPELKDFFSMGLSRGTTVGTTKDLLSASPPAFPFTPAMELFFSVGGLPISLESNGRTIFGELKDPTFCEETGFPPVALHERE